MKMNSIILKVTYAELAMALGIAPENKIVSLHQRPFEFKTKIVCFKVVGPSMSEVEEGGSMEEMGLVEFHQMR